MKKSSTTPRKSRLDKKADELVKQHEKNEKLKEKVIKKDIFKFFED